MRYHGNDVFNARSRERRRVFRKEQLGTRGVCRGALRSELQLMRTSRVYYNIRTVYIVRILRVLPRVHFFSRVRRAALEKCFRPESHNVARNAHDK